MRSRWYGAANASPPWPVIWACPPGPWAGLVQAANGGQGQNEPKTLAEETPEQRELRRLRQENDYLRQQRVMLKKALGILSAEMPPHATR